MTTQLLPDGFAALEPYAARFAGETGADRARIRREADPQELAAFHAAASSARQAALAWLDARPIGGFDERDERLMRLMLMLAHAALAVEVQQADEPGQRRMGQRMKIVRAMADL